MALQTNSSLGGGGGSSGGVPPPGGVTAGDVPPPFSLDDAGSAERRAVVVLNTTNTPATRGFLEEFRVLNDPVPNESSFWFPIGMDKQDEENIIKRRLGFIRRLRKSDRKCDALGSPVLCKA